ncbi:pyruvate dehydrogenase complex dihydrolipoamide acetyltransferase [Rickettsia endosymbiont of Cardiosporidium cionae]|uniref:pyruvate dehydrogenase complex dihydrolipoamide acetyltransferase n=1 Tax=Rickettsia endosymbiont of Cardiosporidium cionae TaxID=2777155 RepID=UPI001894A2A3|nr:pyruvate dehydrogenase complex dihydrolipoamide acetyltransferase [Rickettsia endosymbiont of Cardiosporidium cionae]KAF8818793.1 pyruvate dehydrogenase complex dihydrolipoamide acetyltransferase [Rickettsia endosymbiont of Cardiosporidium cionae]
MPIKILMPALSPTMTKGNLTKWCKKEGDYIKPGEILAEIETDKAVMEVESVDEGVLAKILIAESSNDIAVNSVIAVVLEEDENDKDLESFLLKINSNIEKKTDQSQKRSADNNFNINKTDTTETGNSTSKNITSSNTNSVNNKSYNVNSKLLASPLARSIAKQLNINLSNVKGSGPNGRIIKQDILSYNKTQYTQENKKIDLVQNEFCIEKPVDNMRKIIAEKLLASKTEIPHFYLSIDCRIDKLIELRTQINSELGESININKISLNDLIIKITAMAIKKIPEINSSWNKDTITYYSNVDISIAVAVENGLITPIIKNANTKTIAEISLEAKDLIARARSSKLKLEEFQGGNFSISNLGMYKIKQFNAIINPPQSAILAVSAGILTPIVNNNKIEIANMMNVTLSADHRVIDGIVGAKFLSLFKKYIESPILLLTM